MTLSVPVTLTVISTGDMVYVRLTVSVYYLYITFIKWKVAELNGLTVTEAAALPTRCLPGCLQEVQGQPDFSVLVIPARSTVSHDMLSTAARSSSVPLMTMVLGTSTVLSNPPAF